MSESTEGTPTRARQIEIDKEARLSALQAENTKLKARVNELEEDLRIRNAELDFSIGAVKNYDGKINKLESELTRLRAVEEDFENCVNRKVADDLREFYRRHPLQSRIDKAVEKINSAPIMLENGVEVVRWSYITDALAALTDEGNHENN